MRRTIPLLLLLLFSVNAAVAQPRQARRERIWDPTGWVLLGERDVSRGVDRDRIEVGKQEGSYSKLTLVVEEGDLEVLDFAVQFKNGGTGPQNWQPKIGHFFREGQRTRVIDLPGDKRTIRWIDMKLRKASRGDRVRVAVWGFREGDASVADPQYRPPGGKASWNNKGWVSLGEQAVNRRVDKDRIQIGEQAGAFQKLTIVVEDGDLEMLDFAVQFKNGGPGPQNWHPPMKVFFKEGDRTRAIDLPGKNRTIRWVEFKYKNADRGSAARVSVWGLRAGDASVADPEFKPPTTSQPPSSPPPSTNPPPPSTNPPPPPPPSGPSKAPPPRRAENVTPKTGYVWARGHYEWRNGDYVWIPGHWERAKARMTWRDANWELRGGVWVFVQGGWR